LSDASIERVRQQSTALAAHIRGSRERILSAWREYVDRDPELTTAASISRAQFTDSIPRVLDAFELALRADDALRETQADVEQREGASEHGLQRWQQGYDLRETMHEWAHLHRCILAQLEEYGAANPQLEGAVMRRAREALVRLCGDGACESASRYTRLQQAEAAGRMRDLELALGQLRSLEKNRTDLLRQAVHDLRGSVGVISNASAVLVRSTSDGMRVDFEKILERAIHSTHALLTDLIELTRLEAGQDRVRITSFDVSELMRSLGESLRAEAAARGLFLKMEGPPVLQVTGDPVKVQRIAQNLVLNALKATGSGGVTITWQEPIKDARWTLCIEDTGPGLTGSHATPLTDALTEATEQAHEDDPSSAAAHDAPRSLSGGTAAGSGEGIGLSIVKRLCELLGAAIELESQAGHGTLFRLSFPADVAPAVGSAPHSDA
jgi:signal transduction histidine kinase